MDIYNLDFYNLTNYFTKEKAHIFCGQLENNINKEFYGYIDCIGFTRERNESAEYKEYLENYYKDNKNYKLIINKHKDRVTTYSYKLVKK